MLVGSSAQCNRDFKQYHLNVIPHTSSMCMKFSCPCTSKEFLKGTLPREKLTWQSQLTCGALSIHNSLDDVLALLKCLVRGVFPVQLHWPFIELAVAAVTARELVHQCLKHHNAMFIDVCKSSAGLSHLRSP